MWPARVFFAFLAIAWADRLNAVEYKPDTREALAIRPEKPIQRLQAPQTCIDRPQPIHRAEWRIEDASGNVIEAGTIFIRRRC